MKTAILLTLTLTIGCLFALLANPSPGHAQDMTVQEHHEFMLPEYDDNLDQYGMQSLETFFASGVEQTLGNLAADPNNPQANGAIQHTGKFMARVITDPPVKTSEYVADVLNNTGLASPAYAQGFGYSALTPVLNVWKAFRNLAYFLFIIIFVVVGFMIMLRAQLNPQTVVTVQAALPKMVLSLILITFSYAIAGFVVDLIYLIMFVATSLLATFGVIEDPTTANNVIFGFSIFRIGISFLLGPAEVAGTAANAVGNIVAGALSLPSWLDWLTDSLAYLIIAVAILIAMFRTLFTLIISFVSIILYVVFAPLILLLNALPSVNTFSMWIKALVSNAAVFPAVGIMLLIGAALVGGESVRQMGLTPSPDVGYAEGQGWVPPLMVTASAPATGVNAAMAIVGIGIILLLPEVAKLVKSALGVQDGGIGGMLESTVRGGWAPVNRVVGAPVRAAGGVAQATGSYAVNYAGLTAFEKITDKLQIKRRNYRPTGDGRYEQQTQQQDIDSGKVSRE